MTIFGEAAEQYDAGRPGYADELVPAVLADGARTAVEVGAGTGKATVPFAAAGVAVTCVEPDARMAAVLRRNLSGFPDTRVIVSAFEDWTPDLAADLLYAATSWHWVPPDRQWDLAFRALRPGGTVALFWNPQGVIDPSVHAALAEVDRRHGIEEAPHAQRAAFYGPTPGDWTGTVGWPEPSCRADGRFTDLRSLRFRQETRYGTDRYLAFLASVSTYRLLPAGRREAALNDTAAVLDEHGGGIDMLHITDVFLARAQPRSTVG